MTWIPDEFEPPSRVDLSTDTTTGWLAGISMLLNAGWLLVTQVGLIWLSVLVMAALVVCLGESRPAASPGHTIDDGCE